MSQVLDRSAVREMVTEFYDYYVMNKLSPILIDHFTDYAMTLMTPDLDRKEFVAKLGLYVNLFVETWEPQPPIPAPHISGRPGAEWIYDPKTGWVREK